MEIRRAQTTDKDFVLALVAAIGRDDYIPYCFDDWVNDAEGGAFLVAYQDERLLGVANAEFLSERVAWLQALRVAPPARRLGVGTALAQACLDYSARARRQVARLLIDIDNQASLSLTARAGFHKIAEWLRLEKRPGLTDAPSMSNPSADLLPQLVELAGLHGSSLWHTDWNTYDLGLDALGVSLANDTLRVLSEQPVAAMLDVSYDEEDHEYRAHNLLGNSTALVQLLQAVENEAFERGAPLVSVMLAADSPHLPSVQQLGYRFSTVKDANGQDMVDGVTIWEYDLTKISDH